MKKADIYRQKLSTIQAWEDFLLRESGLPGPRGNLELAQVVADMGDEALFQRLLTFTPDRAPTNTPEEFLAFCGVVGLGKLVAGGDKVQLDALRKVANDPRWRIREAVVMALERVGLHDMELLLQTMKTWNIQSSLLEKRAIACGLCQPTLLDNPDHARQTLAILDDITGTILALSTRKSEDFKALKKGLSYAWSIAIVALPAQGKPLLEKWLNSRDSDVRAIMRENLKKQRLLKMDADWVQAMQIQP